MASEKTEHHQHAGGRTSAPVSHAAERGRRMLKKASDTPAPSREEPTRRALLAESVVGRCSWSSSASRLLGSSTSHAGRPFDTSVAWPLMAPQSASANQSFR